MDEMELEATVRLSWSAGKYRWEIEDGDDGSIAQEGGAVDKETAHRQFKAAIERLCDDWSV